MLTVFLLGCGAETYDHRFRDITKTLLADQAQLDQNLNGFWGQRGIWLRVPAGFTEEPVPPDGLAAIRLPNKKRVELPGLLGVFTKDVAAIASDGGTLEVPAGIAVLSNREFLTSRGTQKDDKEKRIDPADFLKLVKDALAAGASAVDSQSRSITVGGRNFQPTLRYDVLDYQVMGSQGVEYDVSLYSHSQSNGSAEVAMIVAAPSRLAAEESLETRIPLVLRTLRIEDAGASAASPSAPPAGPSF